MNSVTIFAITCAAIIGATALNVLGKISRLLQVTILVIVLVWEYWMLGLWPK